MAIFTWLKDRVYDASILAQNASIERFLGLK